MSTYSFTKFVHILALSEELVAAYPAATCTFNGPPGQFATSGVASHPTATATQLQAVVDSHAAAPDIIETDYKPFRVITPNATPVVLWESNIIPATSINDVAIRVHADIADNSYAHWVTPHLWVGVARGSGGPNFAEAVPLVKSSIGPQSGAWVLAPTFVNNRLRLTGTGSAGPVRWRGKVESRTHIE